MNILLKDHKLGHAYGRNFLFLAVAVISLFITSFLPSKVMASGGDYQLVSAPSTGVFFVQDGTKRPFPDELTFLSYQFKWSDVVSVSSSDLGLLSQGQAMSYNVDFRDGQVVSSRSTGVFLVEDGTKRPFPSELAFISHYYEWSDVVSISSTEMNLIPEGSAMNYDVYFRDGQLISSPSKGVFMVENGVRRPFASEQIFLAYSYKWSDVVKISTDEMNLISEGSAMSYDVHFRDGQIISSPSGGVFWVLNGVKRPFPTELTFLSYFFEWSDVVSISSAEMGQIPEGSGIVYNTSFRDYEIVSSPATGVYLVIGGERMPFPNETIFFSYHLTWNDVIQISNTEMNLIPEGQAMNYIVDFREGQLVSSPSTGVYLVMNGTKRAFPSEAIFLSYSYSWSNVVHITNTEMDLIPNGTPMAPSSDFAKATADMNALGDNSIKGGNDDLWSVTGALTNPLPSAGSINGSTITWESSKPEVVSNNGQTIVRPDFGADDEWVVLTATFTYGASIETKEFDIWVIAETVDPAVGAKAELAKLSGLTTVELPYGTELNETNVLNAIHTAAKLIMNDAVYDFATQLTSYDTNTWIGKFSIYHHSDGENWAKEATARTITITIAPNPAAAGSRAEMAKIASLTSVEIPVGQPDNLSGASTAVFEAVTGVIGQGYSYSCADVTYVNHVWTGKVTITSDSNPEVDFTTDSIARTISVTIGQ